MADEQEEVSMERFMLIYRRLLAGQPPVENETTAERAEREILTKEIAEMGERGGIPTIPFD